MYTVIFKNKKGNYVSLHDNKKVIRDAEKDKVVEFIPWSRNPKEYSIKFREGRYELTIPGVKEVWIVIGVDTLEEIEDHLDPDLGYEDIVNQQISRLKKDIERLERTVRLYGAR